MGEVILPLSYMAKILIMAEYGLGVWFSLRLMEEGHSVDWYIFQKDYSNVLKGFIPEPLHDVPADFRKYDLVLFDQTDHPRVAEKAKTQTATIGSGSFEVALEDDREFGIEVMEQAGVNVPPFEVFDNPKEAKRFITKTKKRYVYKPFEPSSGEQVKDATYVASDWEDLLGYIDELFLLAKRTPFMLQEFVKGTECSVNGYFTGEDFTFITSTIEEKKFLDGARGPNTGCQGNLILRFDDLRPPRLFREGLGLLRDVLKQYKFKGPIDLNTIITEDKIYGLEWTPRFGYDSSATEFALISDSLGDFLGGIANGQHPVFNTVAPFAAGVRVAIPPYPSEIKGKHPEGVPIKGLEEDDIIKDVFLYDCCLGESGTPVTAGLNGIIAVPLAVGGSISEAFGRVDTRLEKLQIPNMMWRSDIEACCKKRFHEVDRNGWLR